MCSKLCSSYYSDEDTFKKIVDYSCMNDMFNSCVRLYGSHCAFIDKDSFSFDDVAVDVSHLRAVLKNEGVNHGDTVAIYAPNSYGFVRSFFAITTMGAKALLIPPQFDEQEIFECSEKYGFCHMLFDASFDANLSLLREKKSDVKLISTCVVSELFEDGIDVDQNEPCVIIFTGGTTGKSKGAQLSHRAIIRGVKNGCYGIPYVFDQRLMQIIPMTHVFGLVRTTLFSFYTGSSLLICKNPKDMFRDATSFKPTSLAMVPALAELALNLSKQFGRNMLGPDLKIIGCGAATVAPYLVEEYAKLGVIFYIGYGLTEGSALVCGNPEPVKKPGSIGYLYDGLEYKIVDGELWLKGVNIMDCYVNSPEETENAFEDGWFKTGDLVSVDDDGFMYIVGRKKELIILPNGENVSPAEIEAKFNALDCVQDSLVYALKENGREFLAVQVYPRSAVLNSLGIEDKESYIREQIRGVNNKLPSFKQISKIIIRDQDFIRSPNMKIIRGKNGEN